MRCMNNMHLCSADAICKESFSPYPRRTKKTQRYLHILGDPTKCSIHAPLPSLVAHAFMQWRNNFVPTPMRHHAQFPASASISGERARGRYLSFIRKSYFSVLFFFLHDDKYPWRLKKNKENRGENVRRVIRVSNEIQKIHPPRDFLVEGVSVIGV